MKLYLDDERPCPEGWVLATTASEAISRLDEGGVTHLSLDHDLGPPEAGTGYDVMVWIEVKTWYDPSWPIPEITIHSANPVGVDRMKSVLRTLRDRKAHAQ